MMFATAPSRWLLWTPSAHTPAGGCCGLASWGVVSWVLPASLGWLQGGSTRRRALAASTANGGFIDVVLQHLDAAYSLARYLTKDADAAEDVVQDAVLKAHRAFAGYRGGDSKAWLLTIVRREFIDWSNARRAGRAVFVESEATPGVEDTAQSTGDTPEQALLRIGEIDSVRHAIEALPEPFREAIVLRELEELSYREIAEITGAPIGTVMSRLARARETLAQRLAPVAETAHPREVSR